MRQAREYRKKKRVRQNSLSQELFCLGILVWSLYIFSVLVSLFSNSHLPQKLYAEADHASNPTQIKIPILIYHYVEYVKDAKDTIRHSLGITPYVFENQVLTLKSSGFTFLTPSDINDILNNEKLLPKKSVILSFDDGYEDFYTDVLPILKKYNIRAVQYIVSGFLDQPNYMSREEVREVIKSNLVEIGCHTVHHVALENAAEAVLKEEIFECQNDLWQDFRIKPVSFAYPYGSYSETIFPILKGAGFKNATTTKFGFEISKTNLYEIPRVRPGARMGNELISYLEDEMAKTPAKLTLTRP